jgi:hypothetical protein
MNTLDVIVILTQSNFYLYTCLLNSLKANYKVRISRPTNKHIHTNKKIQQGNIYHLDNSNSINAVISTMVR